MSSETAHRLTSRRCFDDGMSVCRYMANDHDQKRTPRREMDFAVRRQQHRMRTALHSRSCIRKILACRWIPMRPRHMHDMLFAQGCQLCKNDACLVLALALRFANLHLRYGFHRLPDGSPPHLPLWRVARQKQADTTLTAGVRMSGLSTDRVEGRHESRLGRPFLSQRATNLHDRASVFGMPKYSIADSNHPRLNRDGTGTHTRGIFGSTTVLDIDNHYCTHAPRGSHSGPTKRGLFCVNTRPKIGFTTDGTDTEADSPRGQQKTCCDGKEHRWRAVDIANDVMQVLVHVYSSG